MTWVKLPYKIIVSLYEDEKSIKECAVYHEEKENANLDFDLLEKVIPEIKGLKSYNRAKSKLDDAVSFYQEKKENDNE